MKLNHVQVLTTDLEATEHFWTKIIGLDTGYRPPFDFPGAWYYADGMPAIHIVVRDEVGQAGAFDHVALEFSAAEFDAVKDRLDDAGMTYHSTVVPDRGDRQLFVIGPDGVRVELQCPNRD
ncbi:glyoxalase [Marinihelvus fidelis]|uniref:Glyoxalase n=1 Tax=Marinihelvus fidelis TaxID=2613842 RepID=A0A5N0T8U8_9GAMM|nr:VOC family protein [Marinihelvus fidelis]KAA9131370.1 glyoxalase [Marinihelvus fidelis]